MGQCTFESFSLEYEILKALQRLHYEQPTEVQEKVLPVALEGRDVIVRAKTGSGKTAAFGIPLCQNIDWNENHPQALVLSPTRELAIQISEEIMGIGRLKRIKSTVVVGKQPFGMQQRELKQKTHIVVGTPGRVLDHIRRGTLPLEKIRYLVVDEADKMLNMGFLEDMEQVIQSLPTGIQTLLFSATYPEEMKALCTNYMHNPVDIELNSNEVVVNTVEHFIYYVREMEKPDLLQRLLITEHPGRCMIFCRTKENVDNLFDFLWKCDYSCGKLHGGMLQQERLEVMDAFRRGEFSFLVTTDVAARGIDIEELDFMINYDVPVEKESYVHRTGRTGRLGRAGKAITFATPAEERLVRSIEAYVGFGLEQGVVPTDAMVEAARPVFEKSQLTVLPQKDRKADLNRDIVKLYIGGGKKKKLRAGDIVGAVCQIKGVSAEDIGIITILDYVSYVEILNGKGMGVLRALQCAKIKGKAMKVQIAEEK